MWVNSKSRPIAEDGVHAYARSGPISRHDEPSAALPLVTQSRGSGLAAPNFIRRLQWATF